MLQAAEAGAASPTGLTGKMDGPLSRLPGPAPACWRGLPPHRQTLSWLRLSAALGCQLPPRPAEDPGGPQHTEPVLVKKA